MTYMDNPNNFPGGHAGPNAQAAKPAPEAPAQPLTDELCICGSPVQAHYGPDIRFNPPCANPMMWRAECSAGCLNPTFTSFTRHHALELWNERMRLMRAQINKERQP